MTCSKNFGRLLQASCLGLIGMLTVVGCGGSENTTHPDAATTEGGVLPVKVPNLAASAATVSVGSPDVGKPSTPATVIITNNGTAAGTLTVTPSGVAATGCTGSLAVNASCTLSIVATPTVAGPISGSVTVAATGGNALTISVTGNANPPGNFTLDKTLIDLGTLAVGQAAQGTVTVMAQSALTGLTTGVQGADVKIDAASTCTATLAAGQTCTVVVDFSSATAGVPTGDAIVISQGGVTKPVSVTANVLTLAKLGATPTAGSLVAAPGATSAPLVINVGNTGGMTTGQILVALSGATPADFKITSDTCSIVTLASSATCAVTIVFAPAATATVTETATLTITDKGPGASVASVALSGILSLPSLLTISGGPDLGSVAPGASGTEVVFTVTNTAATPTGALSVSVSPATNITISSNACAAKATLNKGDTCTVGLKLTPAAGAAATAVSAILTVASATDSVNASVTGTIISKGTLSATPTSVSFGSVPINQKSAVQTVTIKNIGATATGALSVSLSGTGAAQVTSSGACTGTLAAGATCTVAVQYAPTDTTGVNGTITVTDGTTSVAVPMVGTGLAPSVFTALDNGSFTFAPTVVGYTTSGGSVTIGLVTGATTDSGAITLPITGANAADFAVVPSGTNCTLLQPGQTCTVAVSFTPGDVGARAAVLTVTGAKGGTFQFQLTGTGLALLQLLPLGATATTVAAPYTGLDFGQQPNATAGNVFAYRVVVRGATNPAAASTVPSIAFAPGTPPDFTYVTGATVDSVTTWTPTTSNPCNGGPTLALPAVTSASPWIVGTKTSTNPSIAVNTLVSTLSTDEQLTAAYWTCDFYVQFSPTSGKSATPKTATLTATASAGGRATLTLTGIASGPLTITPAADFGKIPLGTSSAEVDGGNKTLTVTNKAGNTIGQGPLSIALGGANAGDFAIVTDGCSGKTLTTTAGTSTCNIVLAFTPSVAAAETGTLTVTAAGTGETAQATLTGTGSSSPSITVTPTAVAPAAVDFGSVAQNNVGTWMSFTIANPATGTQTGPLSYSVGAPFELYTLQSAGVTAYPAGFCGDPIGGASSTSLNPGANCIIQVRFKPAVAGAATGSLTVLGLATAIPLKGTGTAQLVLSGSAITLVNSAQTLAFGSVGQGATATQTFTVTNNGAGSVTLKVAYTTNGTDYTAGLPPHFSFASSTCADGSTLAAGAPCQMSLLYTGTTPAAQETPQLIITNGSPVDNTNTVEVPLLLTAQSVTPATLALSGFGDYPTIATAGAGATIELGAAPLGTPTGVLTLVFTNTGKVAATGLQTSWSVIVPSGSSDFTVAAESQGTCFGIGGTLAPGATCTVNVRCTPSGNAGDRNATLSLFGQAVPGVLVNLHAVAINTSNTVYANNVGGSNSFYTFAGSTPAKPATGSTVYFLLHNNNPSYTLQLGANADFTGGSAGNDLVISTPSATADFVLSKATTGTAPPACGTTLAPAGQCTFAVTFSPTWSDASHLYRWATVAVTAAGVSTNILGMIGRVQMPATLQLSAAASAGQVTVSATNFTVDFGQIMQGQLSSEVFTITNIGDVATAGNVGLKLLSNSPTGTYAVIGASTCGTTALAPGAAAACTVTVNSQLTSTIGAQSGLSVEAVDLGVPTATGETSAQTFTLAAEVVNPATLTLNPNATAFATSTAAGSTDTTEEITITVANGNPATDSSANRQNTTALAVSLSDATDFTVDTASTCLNTTTMTYYALPLTGESESCTIIVKFTPKTAGALSTTVSVSATTGGTPTPIALTGTALSALTSNPPGTTASPALFTGTQGQAKPFTITYGGSGATQLLKESLGGTNASAFAITADTCYGTALTSGAPTCTVTVSFVGTCSATTAQTATLNVTDGTANSTVGVVMSVGGATAGCGT